MILNFKSILSLGIMVTFFVFPIIIGFIYKETDSIIELKKVAEVKNNIVKEKEVTKEEVTKNKATSKPKEEVEEDVIEKTKEAPKKTSTPNPNISIKSIKKTEKTNDKHAFYLSNYERRVVECVVMGESGGESYQGQLLVAYCILNACKKDGLQPSEVRRIYKYSGWNDRPSKSVKNAVSSIFDNGYKPVNDTPLYFYAPKHCNSTWHETQRYICTVGGHKFFGRW